MPRRPAPGSSTSPAGSTDRISSANSFRLPHTATRPLASGSVSNNNRVSTAHPHKNWMVVVSEMAPSAFETVAARLPARDGVEVIWELHLVPRLLTAEEIGFRLSLWSALPIPPSGCGAAVQW